MSHKDTIEKLIKSKFKNTSKLLSAQSGDVQIMPTGIDVLDYYVFGCGGIPIGKVLELFSQEGAGKTSLGYTCLAAAQNAGGQAVLLDTEHAFDSARAKLFGVNTDDLIVAQPDHVDDVIVETQRLMQVVKEAGIAPVSLVWDSVAGTPTKEELVDEFSSGGYSRKANAISTAMRVLTKELTSSKMSMLCINQTRQKLGVMFGDNTTTPGGNAIKFHSSVRVQLLGGKAVKDTEGRHIGKDLTVMAVKTRYSEPFRKVKLRLLYDSGWDNEWSTLSLAKDLKLIPPKARGAKAYGDALTALGWL